jgi:hypothetical protein
MLHMLQWDPFAGPACMHVGVEGAQAVGTRNCVGADRDGVGVGHTAARDTVRARDTEQRKPPREADAGVLAGATACLREADAGIQTLAPVPTFGR